jgi:biopolymer transport protein ExbB/TolQ
MNMVQLIREGGFIMVPLLLCSVAVWAVVFEKFWGLRKFTLEYQRLHRQAIDLVKQKKIEEVKGLYRSAQDLVGRPYLTLLEDWTFFQNDQRGLLDAKVTRRLVETQLGLKRFLWVLGTISSSAPFIGLFGTVVGIIKSFDSMAVTGKGGFSVVAAGLSEALVATAAGILVAVVAVCFYNYFQIRVQHLNTDFKNKLEDLADYLKIS